MIESSLHAANRATNLLANVARHSECELLACYPEWLSFGSGATMDQIWKPSLSWNQVLFSD